MRDVRRWIDASGLQISFPVEMRTTRLTTSPWAEFQAMRERLDADRLFSNDYLRRVLGG